jgi:sugar/nucleoside kinase (ribokinase family)
LTVHDTIVGVLICALGDLLLDVIVRPAAAAAPDGDTPAVTRAAPGGQAANVAAWAVELGARGRVICRRGDDIAGELVTKEVERHGVEVRGPVVEGRSGVVVSLVDGEGRRTMLSDRGVAPQLEQIDEAWLEGADWLHVSGYSLLREPIARAALAAARLAPRVSVDLSSAPGIRAYGVDRFRALLRELGAELVFANEEEREVVGDLDARWVLKLGARGARFPEEELPARAAEVVDATGAGDALAAGYLVGGPELALDAAARCVGRMGAMPW